MDPPGRHLQTWCVGEHSTDFGPIQTDTEKTWCNSEHIGVGTLRQTHQTRCIIEHKETELGPSKKRSGALVSTYQIGPYRQTLTDVVHS